MAGFGDRICAGMHNVCRCVLMLLCCAFCSLPFAAAAEDEEDWLGGLLDDLYNTPDSRSEGVRYFNEKKYHEALQEFQKALDEEVRLCGKNTAAAAEIIAEIAMVKDAMADYKGALHDFLRALKIQEKVLADDDFQKVYTCNSIGLMYKKLGDFQAALNYYSKALKMCIGIKGETSSECAAIFINIGDVYTAAGKYDSALEDYRAALEIYRKLASGQDPDTAGCLSKIAVAYSLQKDHDTAVKYFAAAINSFNELKIENSDTVLLYLGYGQATLGAGDVDRAEQLLRQALKKSVKILGNDHEITAMCRDSLRVIIKRK